MNPDILKRMNFRPNGHNSIFTDHLESITDFLIERCPIDKNKACLMLRGSTGISQRYVTEHINSLIAWDIVRVHKGELIWCLNDEKKPIQEETIILPICTDEIKPCKFRPSDGACNPLPNKIVIPNARECNVCEQREEA